MAKFCPECGQPIKDSNNQFCPKCGSKLPESVLAISPRKDQTSATSAQTAPSFYIPPKTSEKNVNQESVQQQTQPLESGTKKRSTGEWIAICCGGAILLVVLSSVFSYVVLGPSHFNTQSSSTSFKSQPIATTPSIEQIKNNAQTIAYDDLFRYNENYIGKIIYFRGEILQIETVYGDNYIFRVATKKSEYLGYIEDVLYVNYKGSRYLQGDTIDLWGRVDGLETYTAVLGNEHTIPKITALHTELVAKAK